MFFWRIPRRVILAINVLKIVRNAILIVATTHTFAPNATRRQPLFQMARAQIVLKTARNAILIVATILFAPLAVAFTVQFSFRTVLAKGLQAVAVNGHWKGMGWFVKCATKVMASLPMAHV